MGSSGDSEKMFSCVHSVLGQYSSLTYRRKLPASKTRASSGNDNGWSSSSVDKCFLIDDVRGDGFGELSTKGFL